MKRLLCAVLTLMLCFVAAACAPAAEEPTPEAAVVFTDDVLEQLIRTAMNKPEGDITVSEAEAVTELNLEMDGAAQIARVGDLTALKYFTNLTNLNLDWAVNDGGNPTDLSPLSGLTKLEYLYLCCDSVTDLSPLAGMVKIKDLWIWGNGTITDLSALSGMTQIESLWIKGNQITDLSPLSGMTELVYLYMEDNQVTDLTPLSGMTKLKSLLLSGNPVTDYSPLAGIYSNLEEKDFDLK